MLKFDKTGRFVRAWGGKGAGPGQFDIAHSIVVDAVGSFMWLHISEFEPVGSVRIAV